MTAGQPKAPKLNPRAAEPTDASGLAADPSRHTAARDAVRAGGSWMMRAYPFIWVLLAGSATAYLTTSVAWSQLVARFDTDAPNLTPEPNTPDRATAALHNQIIELKRENVALTRQSQSRLTQIRSLTGEVAAAVQKVASAEARLASLKTDAASRTTPLAKLPVAAAPTEAASVASPPVLNVETQPDRTAEVAAAQPPQAILPVPLNATAAPTPAPATTEVAAPLPQQSPKQVAEARPDPNAPPLPFRVEALRPAARLALAASRPAPIAASNITTGSVPVLPVAPPQTRPEPQTTRPITFGQAVVTAAVPTPTDAGVKPEPQAGGALALKLSKAPSLASLKLSWRVLNERHGSLLQGLKPRYRTTDGGVTGQAFELVAGPVETRAEADQLCGILRVQSVNCSIDSFAGTAL